MQFAALLPVLKWLAEMTWGFFKGDDKNKHKRIAAALIIALLVPPALPELAKRTSAIYHIFVPAPAGVK